MAEAHSCESVSPYHLDYSSLTARRPEAQARRVILSDLCSDILDRDGGRAFEAAEDGLELNL
ncbi:MAG: hypothetical protein GC191_03080 [Azospirillum sp.]|nr:hypothetical protein [Azospirillum sp.]